MNEQEQIAWCTRERATVWFGKDGVKIKVKDFTGGIKGKDIADAIGHIEKFRRDRVEVRAALKLLDDDEKWS